MNCRLGQKRILMLWASICLVIAGCGATEQLSSNTASHAVGPDALSSGGQYPAFEAGEKVTGIPLAKVGDPSANVISIIGQNTDTRQVYSALLSAEFTVGGLVAHAKTANLDWNFIGCGDFNKDGQTDFLWQHKATRNLGLWMMNGDTIAGGGSLPTPSPGWVVGGVADVDGDGNSDVVWHNPTSRAVAYWKMNGTTVSGASSLGQDPSAGESQIKAVSSGRGGQTQIVWQSSGNGNVEVWTGRGTQFTWQLFQPLPTGLEIRGCDGGSGGMSLLVYDPTTQEVGQLLPFSAVAFPNPGNSGFVAPSGTPSQWAYRKIATAPAWQPLGVRPAKTPFIESYAFGGTYAGGCYDATRHRLYLSNSSQNRIDIVDPSSKRVVDSIAVTDPHQLDLSADGSILVIACGPTVSLVHLDTAAPTVESIALPTHAVSGGIIEPFRSISVACAANNHALVGGDSSDYLDLDLSSRTPSLVVDPTKLKMVFKASTDRQKVVGMGQRVGAFGTLTQGLIYSAVSSASVPTPSVYIATSVELAAGLDRWSINGSVYEYSGLYRGRLQGPAAVFDSNGRAILARNDLATPASEASRLFLHEPSYLQNSYITNRGFPLNAQLIAGGNPSEFFCLADSYVTQVRLPENLPPVSGIAHLEVPVGQQGATRVQAYDPEGKPLTFQSVKLPAGSRFDAATGMLYFEPTSATPDGDDVATIAVDDGQQVANFYCPFVRLPSSASYKKLLGTSSVRGLVLDVARGRVYVCDTYFNRVAVFDYINGRILDPVSVDAQPIGIDITADGQSLVVVCQQFLDQVDLSGTSARLTGSFPLPAQVGPTKYVATTTSNMVMLGTSPIPYKFDLSTQTFSPVTSLPSNNYKIVRSSLDRNFVGVSNGYNGDGRVGRLDANLSNFLGLAGNATIIHDLFLGRNGLDVLFGSRLTYSYVHPSIGLRFENLALNDNQGFAWAGGSRAYQLKTNGDIEALNIPALTSRGIVDIPKMGLGTDSMVVTPDGQYLIIANGYIYIKKLDANGL